MILDYFDELANILDFSDSEYCYVVTICSRKKDNIKDWIEYYPGDKAHMIKMYFVNSKDRLYSIHTEVKDICNAINGRAYINAYAKKISVIKEQYKTLLLDDISFIEPSKLLPNNSIFEEIDVQNDKCLYAGIDLDGSLATQENIEKYFNVVLEVDPNAKLLKVLTTPNGKWILCTYFDNLKFFKRCEELGYEYVGAGTRAGIPLYSNLDLSKIKAGK